MKKIIIFVLLALASTNVTFSKKVIINILHTSDTHSRIEPIATTSKDKYAGKGGILRRANIFKEARKVDKETIILDCGDYCQGTPYFNMFKGDVEVEMINRLGYDAVSIGNHEFDFGQENMARLYKKLKCPVLCANYDVSGTVLEGIVKPYTILKRHGVKIGIIGLGPILDGLVQADKYGKIRYLNPATSAQKIVDELRNQKKCDLIICISHLGIAELTPENDEYLIKNTSGIDLVLGGHSHTYMNSPKYYPNSNGQSIPLLHTGKSGVYVGKVQLTCEK